MKTFAVVFACLVAVALAGEIILMNDVNVVRKMNVADGSVSVVGTNRVPTRAGNDEFAGVSNLVGFAVGSMGELFAVDAQKHVLVKYTKSGSTFSAAVFAGQSGTTGHTDGKGTNAQFVGANVKAITTLKDGTILIAEKDCIRRVAADGTVDTPTGLSGTAALTDGTGTTPRFTNIIAMVADVNDNVWVLDTSKIRKVTPSFEVSSPIGSATTAYADAEGTGTSILIGGTQALTISADGKYLYFATSSVTVATAEQDTALTATLTTIRKIDVTASIIKSEVVIPRATDAVVGSAAIAASAPMVDGVGSSGYIGLVPELIVSQAGDLIFSNPCTSGEVIRKVTPNAADAAQSTVSTISGDLTVVGCVVKPTKGANNDGQAAPVYTELKDGAATEAVFNAPRSFTLLVEVCGKFYTPNGNISAANCDLTEGGSVPKLDVTGTTAVTAPLVIATVLTVGSNGKITANAPINVTDAIVMSGNGTLVVNGFDVIADSVTFGSETTYSVLINKLTPAILNVKNAASLAGIVVVTVAKDFDFNAGSVATILKFASRGTTGFARVFLVKLRTAARRSLQQAAAGANVNCGATACTATGTKFSGDDDDETGLIVALAVVGVLLALVIFGAIFLVCKKTSDANVEKILAQTGDNLSSSSSSSSYEFGAFDDDFTYSYTY